MNNSYIVSTCNCCQKNFKHRKDTIQLCTNCKRKSKRLAYRISAANYKHNKCEICGLERNTIDDLDLFDFHHIDRKDKSFELGDNIESKSWQKVKDELDKCMMLCAICHRKQHLYKRNETVIKFAKNLLTKYS